MKKLYVLLAILTLLPILHLKAQEVDLLWQAETYTPPFYQGRSLWSNQSRINFVAIPQGLGNPATLYYKWIRNGTVLGNINGVGRTTVAYDDTVLSRPQTVKVEIISNKDGAIIAESTITVAPISPIIAVYENNPLYGFTFHRETSGAYQLLGREVTFSAFPFFFTTSGRADSGVGYQWSTNAGEPEAGNSVTYRSPDNASGSSEVRVRATNKNQIMQDANRNFSIHFGSPTITGL